jgi:hypothetical protein
MLNQVKIILEEFEKKLIQIQNKISFLSIFIFFGVCEVFLCYHCSIRYEENDDIAMLLISSGNYNSALDNHLVFINFIFGSFLNFLYSIQPKIEWYSISFLSLNLIAISMLVKVVLNLNQRIFFKIGLLIFLISIFLQLTFLLQFTRTSSILALAGLSFIYNSNSKLIGVFVFLIGSLIRFHAAILIVVLFLPMFFFSSEIKRDCFRSKKIQLFLTAIILAVLCKIGDNAYYNSNPDWKNFLEFNSIRGLINDNPNVSMDKCESLRDILGEDIVLLFNAHANPQTIRYNEINLVYSAINEASFSGKIRNAWNMIHSYWYQFLILFLMGVLFFVQNRDDGKKSLITIFIFFAVSCYIAMHGTLKLRVFESAFCAIVLILAFINNKRGLVLIFGSVFLLVCFLSSILFVNTYKVERSTAFHIEKFSEETKLINEYLNKENVIIPYGNSYKIEYMNPFKISSQFPTHKIFFSGWFTGIPHNKGVFDSFKLYINNYSLLTDKNRSESATQLISASILNQYGIKVTPEVAMKNGNLVIIKFRTPG